MIDQSTINNLLKILVCPVCKSNVVFENEKLFCKNRHCDLEFPIIDDIPIMLPELSKDFELTQKKWNEEYKNYYSLETINLASDPEINDTYCHVNKYLKSKKGLFLEAGCGPARLSFLLAKEGIKTVGIDFSLNALLIARNLFKRERLSGSFVCGDVLRMPFRENIFSFSYTGGVLEHIRDVQGAVNDIFRCLASGGFTTNTVPHVSLTTPYRMIQWGNIPDIPGLRSVIEFTEVEVLKGKRMRFGYEKSFTMRKIKSIFSNVGFKNVEAGLFKTYYPLEAVPSGSLKRIITITANSSRFFWPMIYVNGEK